MSSSVARRCEITFQIGDQTKTLTDEDLGRYAADIGLERAASGRYAWTFAADILLRELTFGIEPWTVIEEVRRLENGVDGTRTKGAMPFEREPLRGLWHKHYFSARFVAANMQIELRGRIRRIVTETIREGLARGEDEEIATRLSHRATREPIEVREKEGRLTGEWIVFAKYNGQNYYLCLAEHNSGDQAIFDIITGTCFPQFPFLRQKAG